MPAASSAPVVAVLAGGRGERLGGGKPNALLSGEPLISYPLRAASAAGLEAVVIAKPATVLPPLAQRIVYDGQALHHPLAGLLAALREHETVIALGCDMPFVSPAMLRWLAEQRAPAVIRRHGNFLQPFPALYLSRDVSALQASMLAQRSMRASIEDLQPAIFDERELDGFGDPARLFFSVNTATDLQLAQSWLAASQTAAAR
jgi:molybdenum cofactor guanylyltransferase